MSTIYRIGNFFIPLDALFAKDGTKHWDEGRSSSFSLTNFVRFRMETEEFFGIRDLAIELYSDQSIYVFIRAPVGKAHFGFIKWWFDTLQKMSLKKEDYTYIPPHMLGMGSADSEAIRFNSFDALSILLKILKEKISIDSILLHGLADCLGTLLAYGFNPFTYCSKTLQTTYELIYGEVRDLTAESLQNDAQLNKMGGYFQPPLRRAPTNTATTIYLSTTPQQIKSYFLTRHPDGMSLVETVFKPASQLSLIEKEQFSLIVEANFDALITEEDRLNFVTTITNKPQLLSVSEAEARWCSLIEKQFDIQAKKIPQAKPVSQHLFRKFNDAQPAAKHPENYRAVPTFFSGSRKENREKLNPIFPSNEQHLQHLHHFAAALEPLVAGGLNVPPTACAKL